MGVGVHYMFYWYSVLYSEMISWSPKTLEVGGGKKEKGGEMQIVGNPSLLPRPFSQNNFYVNLFMVDSPCAVV